MWTLFILSWVVQGIYYVKNGGFNFYNRSHSDISLLGGLLIIQLIVSAILCLIYLP